MSDLSALTDREIDAIVAGKVMGERMPILNPELRDEYGNYLPHPEQYWSRFRTEEGFTIWIPDHFCELPDASHVLKARMRELGWTGYKVALDLSEKYTAWFYRRWLEGRGCNQSELRAIAEAAIMAVRAERKQG